jgi:hypothetical protein
MGNKINNLQIALPNKRGKFSREIATDYNEINLLETEEAKQAKVEMWIAKNIGDELMKVYPNREWGIRVNIEGAVVIITCDSLSVEKGYHIHMVGRTIHQLQAKAVNAAGEILERHGITRNKHIDEDIFETLKRDSGDNVITEDSGAGWL